MTAAAVARERETPLPGLLVVGARDHADSVVGEVDAKAVGSVGRLPGGVQIGESGPVLPGDPVLFLGDLLLHTGQPIAVHTLLARFGGAERRARQDCEQPSQ